MFKIQKEIHKGNYMYALVPEHPNATKNGYVLLHRVVMENHLGRLLLPEEVVHHIDENKFNNSIENLRILSKVEHAKLHQIGHERTYKSFTCPQCGKIFSKEIRECHGSRKYGPFCSRSCSGKFTSKLKSAAMS